MVRHLGIRHILALVVFFAGLLSIYIGAFAIICGRLVRMVRRKPAPPAGAWRRWLRRIILAAAAAGALCVAYAYFIEPYYLEVRYVQTYSPKLAVGCKPIRVVHVSDLHCEAKVRLEDRAADEIASVAPDIIVYTGDSLNCVEGLSVCQKFLRRLADIAPTYCVRGNWDRYFPVDPFAGTGVTMLDGTDVSITIRDTPVSLSGLDDVGGWTKGIAQPGDPSALNIRLDHRPDLALEAADKGYDMYFAGHTHGGQVALPGYGALITLSALGKRFEAGSYRVDKTFINVNRGLGIEGNMAPRVRFCARPEVTVVDVYPAR